MSELRETLGHPKLCQAPHFAEEEVKPEEGPHLQLCSDPTAKPGAEPSLLIGSRIFSPSGYLQNTFAARHPSVLLPKMPA